MISDEVYEQVVAELDEVRREWQNGIREMSLALERAARCQEISRRAEAELTEVRKELDIRKRELRACHDEKVVLVTQRDEANQKLSEYRSQNVYR